MRVGINLLHLVPGETGGMETYARSLIPALLKEDRELELVLFSGREGRSALEEDLGRLNEQQTRRAQIVELPLRSSSRPLRVMAEQYLLPRAVRRAQIELLHNAFNTAPALPGVTQLTTIHDLSYRHFPQGSSLLTRGAELLIPLAVKRSARLLTVSESTKKDIIDVFAIEPQKIDVALLGPGADPVLPEPEPELRRRLDLGVDRVLLTVSPNRAHKNLGRLERAIGSLPDGVLLLIPGYGDSDRATQSARVRRLGWVDDRALEGLYRLAACVVVPSQAEGFGLPVLEAMRRQVPVACSDIPVLHEVAADAALYFDPEDEQAMAAAVSRLLEDDALRQTLIARGQAQAAKFSWAACAQATLASYYRAALTEEQA